MQDWTCPDCAKNDPVLRYYFKKDQAEEAIGRDRVKAETETDNDCGEENANQDHAKAEQAVICHLCDVEVGTMDDLETHFDTEHSDRFPKTPSKVSEEQDTSSHDDYQNRPKDTTSHQNPPDLVTPSQRYWKSLRFSESESLSTVPIKDPAEGPGKNASTCRSRANEEQRADQMKIAIHDAFTEFDTKTGSERGQEETDGNRNVGTASTLHLEHYWINVAIYESLTAVPAEDPEDSLMLEEADVDVMSEEEEEDFPSTEESESLTTISDEDPADVPGKT